MIDKSRDNLLATIADDSGMMEEVEELGSVSGREIVRQEHIGTHALLLNTLLVFDFAGYHIMHSSWECFKCI